MHKMFRQKDFLLFNSILNFLTIDIGAERSLMQSGNFVDLLPCVICSCVILLMCFFPRFHIFNFQIQNWNLVAYYLSTCLFGWSSYLIWFTCLLDVRFKKYIYISFVVHFELFIIGIGPWLTWKNPPLLMKQLDI